MRSEKKMNMITCCYGPFKWQVMGEGGSPRGGVSWFHSRVPSEGVNQNADSGSNVSAVRT